MRVLFRIRSDFERFPGGDLVQLERTREGLEALGVETALLPGVKAMPSGFDLVHLFNLTRLHETAVQFDQARARGVPVVVSTIWHSNEEMQKFYGHLYGWPWFPFTTYQSAKELWYAHRSGLPIPWALALRFRARQREIAMGADALLPNSAAELEILCRELRVKPRASFVVPNGFAPIQSSLSETGARRDVLCIGRIEPRKNQLGIIRAFKRLPRGPHRLLIYGAMNEGHDRYASQARAELVPGWVEYMGCVSQEDIYAACQQAAVVVLASFFETCGLVVMEALSCGANACVTRSPYLEDYYGTRVEYCDPYDTASIAEGLAAALARPPERHDDYLRHFSWTRAAEVTFGAYQHILTRQHVPATAETALSSPP